MRHGSMGMAVLALGLLAAPAASADEATLQAEIDALRTEVAALKTLVRQMGAGRAASSGPAAPASATRAPETAPAQASAEDAGAPAAIADGTRFWGYGELNYNRPTARTADAQADLRRAVLGFGHAFDEATHVYGEIEWEHAVASAEDEGETEIEQLYVEHALGPAWGVRAGLMLVPLGLLNGQHEPAAYFGVERNFVETAIIPSTWREGGVALYGASDAGLSWNVGIGTGPDLGKWDPASDEGRASPLGSIHQELQLARARDLSVYAALDWQGVPGLTVGGGAFTGKIAQGAADFPAADSRLLLGEAHARWQVGTFDLSALYARGTISDTQALNLTFLGQATPVPKAFWGGYAQAAWRALEWGRSSLMPFLRYAAFNTASEYAAQPERPGAAPLPTERVWTAGANYYLNPNVVFKFDYQRFNRADPALGYGNRIDLGIGYQF